jgi:hypothetical protein
MQSLDSLFPSMNMNGNRTLCGENTTESNPNPVILVILVINTTKDIQMATKRAREHE